MNNQRIRELAKQAQLDGDSIHYYSSAFAEKFAELIVRECCQYLNKEAERLYALSASEHRPNFREDFEICAEKCLDNIQGLKDHFGVEE